MACLNGIPGELAQQKRDSADQSAKQGTRAVESFPGRLQNHSVTILVVEDEPRIRTSVCQLLVAAGCRVFEACEAREALMCLNGDSDIQIVLTDIEMPGEMDGVALARLIHMRWPAIAILVHSGRVGLDIDALPKGAGYLEKPCTASRLIGQLAELAAQRLGLQIMASAAVPDAWLLPLAPNIGGR